VQLINAVLCITMLVLYYSQISQYALYVENTVSISPMKMQWNTAKYKIHSLYRVHLLSLSHCYSVAVTQTVYSSSEMLSVQVIFPFCFFDFLTNNHTTKTFIRHRLDWLELQEDQQYLHCVEGFLMFASCVVW